MKTSLLAISIVALLGGAAFAQGVQPAAMPAEIAAPKDVAYPGTIRLHVDATDTDRHIYRVRQTIPVPAAGPMTLLFPRWLPGTHAPTGRIEQLAGLTIRAGATRLEWTRDSLDGFAFRVTVPNATPALEIEFQILTAVDGPQGRIVMTDEMLNLQWNAVALYPAGYFTSRIPVEASVRLPEGWQFGVALDAASDGRRRHDVQDGAVRSARRLADVRGPLFQAFRARAHGNGAGVPECRRGSPGTARGEARAYRGASLARRSGAQAVRLAITTAATISCSR